MSDFDSTICETMQAQMDSDLSSGASDSFRDEIKDHLVLCRRCSEFAASRLKAKGMLQGAIHRQAVPPHLDAKIRRRLRDAQRNRLPISRWMPALGLAAAVLLVVVGGRFVWRGETEPWKMDKAGQERYIESLYAQVVEIMRPGLGDHLHCAHFRRFSQNGASLAEMASKMGPEYAALIPVVKETMPRAHRIVLAHQCSYRDRRFVHVVVRGEGRLLSLVVTRKQPGESMASAELAAPRRASGVPVYHAAADRFEVAAFEAGDHLAFVVSDLAQDAHFAWAASLAPAVHRLLTVDQG